jgi:hypothetical protein
MECLVFFWGPLLKIHTLPGATGTASPLEWKLALTEKQINAI